MKFQVGTPVLEEPSLKPLTLTLTLETKEEMLMLAAVFNSSQIINATGIRNHVDDVLRQAITKHLKNHGITTYYDSVTVSRLPAWVN
jgi:hypothetical protein